MGQGFDTAAATPARSVAALVGHGLAGMGGPQRRQRHRPDVDATVAFHQKSDRAARGWRGGKWVGWRLWVGEGWGGGGEFFMGVLSDRLGEGGGITMVRGVTVGARV